MTTTSKMRELSVQETRAVAGGPLPLIGLALNLAARVVVSQLGQHFIRSGSLIASSYATAQFLDDN